MDKDGDKKGDKKGSASSVSAAEQASLLDAASLFGENFKLLVLGYICRFWFYSG